MRDSVSGLAVGLALVFCCAMPIVLLLAGASMGGGIVLGQQALIGAAASLMVLGVVVSFLRGRRR